MSKKRVLIISDSLGTPIHPRGIFNYTCGLVQALNTMDYESYLLVEPPNSGITAQTLPQDLESIFDSGTSRVLISELIKHFEGERFRFDWEYSDSSLNHTLNINPALGDFYLATKDTKSVASQLEVKMPKMLEEIEEFPFSRVTEHLAFFTGFIFSQNIYSESLTRAYKGLRPTVVDASNFDYVIIDTPTYILPYGIDKEKVAYVIHDFIPVYDLSMGMHWRAVFARKIKCTIQVGKNAIFNSETTEKSFDMIYGDGVLEKRAVIYPPIRQELLNSIAHYNNNPLSEDNRTADLLTNAKSSHQPLSLAARKELNIDDKSWNHSLPFFVSVLSDEPRKNIAAIVEASKKFVGKANFIVAGQINGNYYMDHQQRNYPNLHFPGYISDTLKFELMRNCKAFIFPSLSEGFGIPITEGAVSGVPVICTDIPVFREISFGKAYYFKPKVKDDLARVIFEVLNDENRLEKAEELRVLSLDTFNQQRMAERLKVLFN